MYKSAKKKHDGFALANRDVSSTGIQGSPYVTVSRGLKNKGNKKKTLQHAAVI